MATEVGVSLDSVVLKAAELEGLLRGCRAMTSGAGRRRRAEEWPDTDSRQSPGEYQYHSGPSEVPSVAPESLSDPQDLPPDVGPSTNETESWHQLTSYIVGLEKQVQYYKSLVEGMQHAAVASHWQEGAGGSPYVEGLFGHEESESYSPQLPPQALGAHQDEELVEEREDRALVLVFSHLDTAELCRVSRVCRRWRRVSRHPLLWRRVSISEVLLPPQTLFSLSQLCGSTERIALHGLMPEMAQCDEELDSYVRRLKGSLEEGVASLLASSGPALLSLSITECNLMITNRVLWLAGVHCPHLQSLTYSSEEFPPSSEALWALAQGARHIQYLYLPPYITSPHPQLTDHSLSTLASSWPYLLGLCVGGSDITVAGLAEVARRCPRLRELEIQHGPQLQSSAVEELCQAGGLAALRTLTLAFTATSSKTLVKFYNNCPQLSSLTLHFSLETFLPILTGPDTLSQYKKILTHLQKLQREPNIRNIIHLYEHYTQ